MSEICPSFSIIIPVYNAAKVLSSTIDSILLQTDNDWELILVDDCSTDNSYQICLEYEASCPFIHTYRLNENSGSAKKPCDIGIKESHGKYCIFIGNDDTIEPNYINKMKTALCGDRIDVAIAKMAIVSESQNQIEYYLPDNTVNTKTIISGKNACLLTLPNWHIGCNGMAFRRNLYDNIFKENQSNYMNSDEFSSRLILFYARTVTFTDAIYFYIQVRESITHKISVKLFEQLYVDVQLITFCKKNKFEHEVVQSVCDTMLSHLISLQKNYYLNKSIYNEYNEGDGENTKRNSIHLILKDNFHALRHATPLKYHLNKRRLFLCNYSLFKLWCMVSCTLKKR